jgi:hypothetical protein
MFLLNSDFTMIRSERLKKRSQLVDVFQIAIPLTEITVSGVPAAIDRSTKVEVYRLPSDACQLLEVYPFAIAFITGVASLRFIASVYGLSIRPGMIHRDYNTPLLCSWPDQDTAVAAATSIHEELLREEHA